MLTALTKPATCPAICERINRLMFTAVIVMAIASDVSAATPPTKLAAQLGTARAETKGDLLQVTSGRVARTWKWTGYGLVTTSFKDETTGREWASKSPIQSCDWDLPGAIGKQTAAQWVSLTARESDDEGFSSKHLEVVSTVRYAQAALEIQQVIWVFPGAPGLRTQLRARSLPGFQPKGLPEEEGNYQDCGATFLKPSARAEYLPLDFSVKNERLYWGYYNNPGNRHVTDRGEDNSANHANWIATELTHTGALLGR